MRTALESREEGADWWGPLPVNRLHNFRVVHPVSLWRGLRGAAWEETTSPLQIQGLQCPHMEKEREYQGAGSPWPLLRVTLQQRPGDGNTRGRTRVAHS